MGPAGDEANFARHAWGSDADGHHTPAPGGLVAEDEHGGVLGGVGVDLGIDLVVSELATQVFDVLRLAGEEVPVRHIGMSGWLAEEAGILMDGGHVIDLWFDADGDEPHRFAEVLGELLTHLSEEGVGPWAGATAVRVEEADDNGMILHEISEEADGLAEIVDEGCVGQLVGEVFAHEQRGFFGLFCLGWNFHRDWLGRL